MTDTTQENNIPILITSGIHEDERGKLIHFNKMDISDVKRMYILEHPNTDVVRAWQAHQYEKKWFTVLQGKFKVVLVKVDNWTNPSEKLPIEEFVLSSDFVQVLHIPGGYATGFQALNSDSKMMIFSNFTLEDSVNDDFRFEKSMWYKW